MAAPKLYHELVEWCPLLSAPADCAEEAEQYRGLFLEAAEALPRTLLELGSGGGNNTSHLKRHFALTLVDRSPAMLAVSRALNPDCEHVTDDMRTVRLGRIFVWSSFTTPSRTSPRRAIFGRPSRPRPLHCRREGSPSSCQTARETFQPRTRHGGHDGEGRGLRYVEWVWDPHPSDTEYTADFAYLLRDAHGAVRVEWDRHLNGLFARDQWTRWPASAGFSPDVREASYEVDAGGGELFLARRVP